MGTIMNFCVQIDTKKYSELITKLLNNMYKPNYKFN